MNKRLISLLLVIVMICALLPMSVLAGDNDSASTETSGNVGSAVEAFMSALKDVMTTANTDRQTEGEIKAGLTNETGAVVVPVFGKELSDILREGNFFKYTEEALQVRLSDKSVVPDVEVVITGDPDDPNTRGIKKTLKESDVSILYAIKSAINIENTGNDFLETILNAIFNSGDTNVLVDVVKSVANGAGIDLSEDGIKQLVNELDQSDFGKLVCMMIGTGQIYLKDNFYNRSLCSALYQEDDGEYFIARSRIFNTNGLGLEKDQCINGLTTFSNVLIDKYGQEPIQNLIDDMLYKLADKTGFLSKYAGFLFRSYAITGLPEGEYIVRINMMDRQGFVTAKLDKDAIISREYKVKVKAEAVVCAGDTYRAGLESIDLGELMHIDDSITQLNNTSESRIIDTINAMLATEANIKSLFNKLMESMEKLKKAVTASSITNPFNQKEIDLPLQIKVAFNVTGAWSDRHDPSIDFTNQDLGGNLITAEKTSGKQAQFIMIDRDELIKLMDAMIGVGKDTFENVLTSLKEIYGNESDITTWEEFVKLHKELVDMKQEEGKTLPQISLDYNTAFNLVIIYVKMMDIPDVWYNFLEKDVRLPAMLKTTADDSGEVHFTEEDNITLVWMLDALVKIAKLSVDAIQEFKAAMEKEGTIDEVVEAVFEGADYENDSLKEMMIYLLTKLSDYSADGAQAAVDILDGTVEAVKPIVNKWIYPILQNDALVRLMYSVIDPDHKDLAHAILTDKMPDGYYLMFQKAAPDGYILNPMVYTVKLDWDEYGWLYAEIANLGIIGPYLAEDYYTFFRNNSIAGTTDKILNLLTNNKSNNIIAKIIDREYDVTNDVISASATMIAAQTWLIYNFMGGRLVYSGDDGQAKLQADLIAYLKAKGQTAENLASFGHDVYVRSKAVVSADLTDNSWAFYNASKSIKENIVAQATAIMKGISGSIVTDGSKVNGAVKDAIDKVIEGAAKIDTTSKLAATVDQARQKVTETVTKVATSLITTAIKKTASLFSSLFKSLRS